jgi:hypothetical protein
MIGHEGKPSYPVIKDGLIYVVDPRNGLYSLEYEGVFHREVGRITFWKASRIRGTGSVRAGWRHA